MPEIKERSKAERPKGGKRKGNETGRQMKAAYLRELAKSAGSTGGVGKAEENPGEYATERVEAGADYAARTGVKAVKSSAAELRQAYSKPHENRNRKDTAQEGEKRATGGESAKPRNEPHSARNGREMAVKDTRAAKQRPTVKSGISDQQRTAWREQSRRAAVKGREEYGRQHGSTPMGNASQIETHFDKAPYAPAPTRTDTQTPISSGIRATSNNASQIETHFDMRERRPHGPTPAAATPRAKAAPQGKPALSPKTKSALSRPIHPSIHPAERQAKRQAVRELTQKAAQKTVKRAEQAGTRLATAIGKTAESGLAAIAGIGAGGVLLVLLLFIGAIGAILASPFGILFANEPTLGAMPLNVAVGQLNMELADKLEVMQMGDYDSIELQGSGPDWREVVAVFAARTAGADDGVDVAALTPDRVDRLKTVFWDMCIVTSTVETIDHPGTDGGAGWTEHILHITITPKSADDMRAAYALTARQNSALDELLTELSTMELLLTDLAAQTEKARELVKNLPDDLSPERRAVIENACKLVGKVNYFWGGKSLVLGWDSRWGTIQKVWADGNSTTGTYRPYGLDCSGFVDWSFYNASGGSYVIGHGGGATMQHTYCTPVLWETAQPGDLVFYADDSHVGIVGGRDADGNLLIIHCASSANCVVITGAGGFATVGRPIYYTDLR